MLALSDFLPFHLLMAFTSTDLTFSTDFQGRTFRIAAN